MKPRPPPGEHGGAAIADTLFGQDSATGRPLPSKFGKLSQTWYAAHYVGEAANMTDFRMRPGPAYCPTPDNCFGETPGRGHRFYTGTPDWRFGDGLSYTSWRIRSLRLSVSALEAVDVRRSFDTSDTPHTASVLTRVNFEVDNAGDRDGDYVCLLFAQPPGAGEQGHPLQVLVDFARVRVRQGGTQPLSFDVRATSLTLTNVDGVREVVTGEWIFFVREQDRPQREEVVLLVK